MQFLRSNTAVIVTVGPFYDKTDGVTIETALTITNERITLTADTDAGSAPTNILDNVTGATSGTSNDLNYITGNDAGMMQLELAAADVNRVGRMKLAITDAANHVPVFHDFFVLPAVIYDWLTAGVAPLSPTTAGRTLDVASTGEAGLDFTNALTAVGSIPVLGWLENGTMQAGSAAGTAVLRSATSLADDLVIGSIIYITGGTGAGQSRIVYDWVSASDTASVSPNWTTTPDNTSVYAVFPAPPAPTNAAALPNVSVTALAGDTQSLTDLKDFADAGYDPSTNKVQGVVLVDTLTTYTGNTVQTGDAYGRLGAPAGASHAADVAAVKVDTAAILVDTGTTLDGRIPAALVGGRMDATVDGTGMESGAINAILDAALADSVPADGALPTVRQAIYMITQFLTERSVSGTTLTIRKVDGSTSLMTFTLSDATSPVSVTRAT